MFSKPNPGPPKVIVRSEQVMPANFIISVNRVRLTQLDKGFGIG